MKEQPDAVDLKNRIDTLLKKAEAKSIRDDEELLEELARYLVILVAGWLAICVRYTYKEYARQKGPHLYHFSEKMLDRSYEHASFRPSQILEISGYFGKEEKARVKDLLPENEEYYSAIDSIINHRHAAAHGIAGDITLHSVKTGFQTIQEFIAAFQTLHGVYTTPPATL